MSHTSEPSAVPRSAEHSTFVIERTYDAAPERVFHAWADADAKRGWFGPTELPVDAYALDFQIGGRERMTIGTPDGSSYRFDAVYQDIVPAQRIVYTYDMHHDGRRISVSLATIEFQAAGAGTKLKVTEQGVYLDGLDTSQQREHGTIELINALGALLDGAEGGA